MKSRLFKITLSTLAVLLCMHAALAESVGVEIGAQIALDGMMPRIAEEYIIRMTADEPTNPMPNGQKGGSCDIVIYGADSAAFPSMTFDAVGIYRYTIREIAGDNADCLYDPRIYHLTVSVVHGETGELAAFVALSEGEEAQKAAMAMFRNAYPPSMPTLAPSTEPGTIPPTGVMDWWMYYVMGAVVMLSLAVVIIMILRRRRRGGHDEED